MASTKPPALPTPCDILNALREAARDLTTWIARIESPPTGDDDTELGQLLEARRVGRIVQSTVTKASQATETVTEHALRAATRAVIG